MPTPRLALVLATLVFAACGASDTTPDAGDTTPDAGNTTPDAGTDTSDAGDVPDAGQPASALGGPCTSDADCTATAGLSCLTEAEAGFRGGYCDFTAGCQADADCPDGSHCATGRYCVKSCATAGECRTDGYACADFDGDTRTECDGAGTGTGAVGSACAGVWECAGGALGTCLRAVRTDHKDGYCTLGCSPNDPCPTGSHCGNRDGDGYGLCLADCVDGSTCRGSGYACADADGDAAKECVAAGTGTGAMGAACTGVWDCAGGVYAVCLSERFDNMPGGACSAYCIEDTRCGAGAHCAYVGEEGGYCHADCADDTSCRTAEGYACFDGDSDDTKECTR